MSGPNNWATPGWLFDALDKEYGFQLDVCAEDWNAKCRAYWTEKENGLEKRWRKVNWLNPPYSGKYPVTHWLNKALVEMEKGNRTIAILKNDPSTRWYCDYVLRATSIYIITGARVQFEPPPGVKASSCAFPSILVDFFFPRCGPPAVYHIPLVDIEQTRMNDDNYRRGSWPRRDRSRD